MASQAPSSAVAIAASHSKDESGVREVLRGENLHKIFRSGGADVAALEDLSLSIAHDEMVALVGPSGSGKSTLLHILAALDTPTSGTVYFAGNSLAGFSESELEDFRRHTVGFIWQRHQLLADFTAAENVAMPLLIQGGGMDKALGTAKEWLDEVGMADRAKHRAGELSGGEQQRVAIARALINHPSVLLADEPTGDLDEQNTELIFELMQRLHRSHHLTSILATHNQSLAGRADRVLRLEHGMRLDDETFAARSSQRAVPGDSSTPGGRG